MDKNDINKIRELIARDELKKAIDQLSLLVSSSDNKDFLNETILISAQFNDLQSALRKDTINFETANVTKNKLRLNILELSRYFEDLSESIRTGKEIKLREAKVIFVGSGNVGKTSLINMLIDGVYNPNELKTEGISIRDLVFQDKDEEQPIEMHFWDFGGQEIMHATHKFFMTQRSLYIIVVNSREEDRYGEVELDYWLKLVNSYAPDSPIIIALNKSDVQKPNIDKRTYKIMHENIIDFIETSCLNSNGIPELKNLIENTVVKLPHLDISVPESYFLVKQKLSQIKNDYISFQEYASICKSIDVNFDEESMGSLVGLLHDVGIVLNFRGDLRLEQTQVLNPEWATRGVYGIVNSRLLIQNKGVLSLNDLSIILDKKRYPRSQHLYIVDLMEKFELCYRMPDSNKLFFVPVAFGAERPESILWDGTGTLKFEYHYDILPQSVMSRFIVRVHPFIDEDKFWKDGVVIRRKNLIAFITSDSSNLVINISIKGEGQRKELLTYIRHHLDDIHRNFKALQIDEKVPYEGVLLDYADLIICKEVGEESIFIPKLRKKVNVKELLDGIEEDKVELNEKGIFAKFGDIFSSDFEDTKKKILFLASNPTDSGRLKLGKEVREVEEGLKRSRNRDNFELIQKFAARPKDLRRAILNDMPNIIHFSGHGDTGAEEGIILENELGQSQPVSGKSLANLFKLFSDEIECVFLNSCYSKLQAEQISKYIPYVIGMSDSITDNAAISFSLAFYDAIGQKRDYEFAFSYAKNSIELEGIEEEQIPILLKKSAQNKS